MEYGVAIWKRLESSVPEIWTWVGAADPIAAALSVMERFGLRAAHYVIVSTGPYETVAEFVDVDLSVSPAPVPNCSVPYDYSR